MKLIVFGATGDVGQHVVAEALGRGHSVTAFARSKDRLNALSGNMRREVGDLLIDADIACKLMAGHDAAIGTLRPPVGSETDLVDLTRALLKGAMETRVPLFVTGGAATLKLADGSGETVLTAPGFLPDAVRPIAEACAAQDALLETEKAAAWTYLRPPALLIQGPRTGNYISGTDTLVTDAEGNSQISYADFAVAMLDLAEARDSHHKRLTVGWP
ncbi:NAD(P)H-binding protein [uncultured Parvibaculum sp.]|uniref:NAD(P)-dependent oxidoreductase n=1 Tax=uncultured Parvibaculum sp. TaxID=291828 RepID=UPI0030DAEE30